ncbi:MAG: hypothetical protein QM737_18900 [Ferruginibacter sp.]
MATHLVPQLTLWFYKNFVSLWADGRADGILSPHLTAIATLGEKNEENYMGKYKLSPQDYKKVKIDEELIDLLNKKKWDEFNLSILGMGNLAEKSRVVSGIAAFFDLEGFTNFCKQIDPQLSVPVFLKKFLNWFFEKIKDETKEAEHLEGIQTWHDLPILTKFLGDGLLVIWDIDQLDDIGQCNIITSCKKICSAYESEFYQVIKKKVSDAPMKLRCGVAKGNVFSVGDGNDYIGPCINYASRLQKLPGITFAFSERGFDIEQSWGDFQLKQWIVKKIKVRGIGDSELVYILKSNFESMSTEDKQYFVDP